MKNIEKDELVNYHRQSRWLWFAINGLPQTAASRVATHPIVISKCRPLCGLHSPDSECTAVSRTRLSRPCWHNTRMPRTSCPALFFVSTQDAGRRASSRSSPSASPSPWILHISVVSVCWCVCGLRRPILPPVLVYTSQAAALWRPWFLPCILRTRLFSDILV